MNIGMLYAATAYALWGIFPLYFKSLQEIPPLEILLHRMVWSLAFVVVVLTWRRHWGWLRGVMRQPKVLAGFAASAVLLSSNWFIYIWAVNNGNVVEASLGYFINPLFNVLLGSLLLRERLRVVQWMAVALAACGVAWLTWHGGHLPWIALLLAATFAFYGLLRKTASLGALEGLALETLLLFPVAFIYLAVLTSQSHNAFITASTSTQLLLAASGPITAIPLLLFAAGARRIPLSLLGLLQYIGPTIQLLLGVWLYHEPFGGARLAGFALIWGALAVYSLEGLWQAWSRKASNA
ncbi:EamA family transporter RarD [Noviherbaspirillum sp. Root189]|uniref:EamA family transporter RarD n=1 Tax=Noviherbaspirillum sp. Root189 TaxID=1736487 RepID=UPI00070FD3B6|nr:EamA family transporter RarD [Noviherbaspirillum sp. Root189]KRB94006.1 transporter [Noviherbaspirillum sp. Root189]